MNSLQILMLIALVVMVCIVLRFVVKRIWLFAVLRKFAKKHGYTCTTPLSCLLPNNRNKHTVQIETGNTIYSIKLFGILRKHCHIHFWSTKEYSIEWYFTRHGLDFTKTPFELLAGAKSRSLGRGNWTTNSEKEVIPVLLISPTHAPVMLTTTDVNHWEHLRAGEKIEDVLFADLDFLLRFIENREK